MEAVMNEQLAKMYALRAGISQMAIDNDNVNGIEQQKKTDCKPILKKQKETKTNINRANREIDRIQEDIDKHKRMDGKMEKIRALKKTVNGIRFAFFAGVVLAIGILYYFFIFNKPIDTWKQILFFGGAFIFLCVALKIVWYFTDNYYFKTRDQKIDIGYETRDYEKTKWKRNDYENKGAEIVRLRKEVQQQEAQLPMYSTQIEQLEEKAKKLSNPCYVRADAIHKGLVQEFSSFIDERDWENLDLIIFAFETGRADNLKEALKFIDEERRANQIVTAVNSATQQICQTINVGFSQMAQAMTLCFNRLSAQIQANADKQQELLNSMNVRLGDMHSQLGNVMDGIDYNNALLKKQNESSEKMMREIRPFLKNANMLMSGELGVHYTETIYS